MSTDLNLDSFLPSLTAFSVDRRPAPGVSVYNPGCTAPAMQSHLRASLDSAIGVEMKPGGIEESNGQRQWLDFNAGEKGVTVNEEKSGTVKESNGQFQAKTLSHLDQGKQVVTMPAMTKNFMADAQNCSVLSLPAIGRLW